MQNTWKVFERTLTDGSNTYDVWFVQANGVGVPEVTVHARDVHAAYECAAKLNEAMAEAV